jgi:putative transposase
VQLVEQHLLRRSDPCYQAIDQAAFAAKNLYNQANYQIRQAFVHRGKYLPYAAVFRLLKHHEAYRALPRKVSNSILIQLHTNWIAFFKQMDAYRQDPAKFQARPRLAFRTKTRKKDASCLSMTSKLWANAPSRKRGS